MLPYRFDDQVALTQNLDGVDTLYNTYWVRFDHGTTTFVDADRQLAGSFAQPGVPG